jgi:hypothetical protein
MLTVVRRNALKILTGRATRTTGDDGTVEGNLAEHAIAGRRRRALGWRRTRSRCRPTTDFLEQRLEKARQRQVGSARNDKDVKKAHKIVRTGAGHGDGVRGSAWPAVAQGRGREAKSDVGSVDAESAGRGETARGGGCMVRCGPRDASRRPGTAWPASKGVHFKASS